MIREPELNEIEDLKQMLINKIKDYGNIIKRKQKHGNKKDRIEFGRSKILA